MQTLRQRGIEGGMSDEREDDSVRWMQECGQWEQQERDMHQSSSIKEIATALAKAQGELGGASKDSNNPAFNSKYADLASIVAAIKACFPKHGLSYVQTPCTTDKDEIGIETMLMHASGEWLRGDPFYMPVAKLNAHGFGSILTYARRYSLAAMAGVAPEDDDANAGVATAPRPNTAMQTARDEFDALPPEAQKIAQEWATEAIAFVENNEAVRAATFLAEKCQTQEDKLAVWALLPSKVRSALKRGESERAAA